ncbi:hypothetical protein BC831DRAFT_439566, partial [Entophlyctis helioformis]
HGHISLAGQDLKPPAAQPAASDNQQLPRALSTLQNQDSGYAASQPKISDAERLVKAFPGWCARKGITAANAQSFDGVVNFQGSEYKILEWENGHLVRLRMYDQGIKSPLPPHVGGFSHLKTLAMGRNLRENKLTQLPDWIDNLTQLTVLVLVLSVLLTELGWQVSGGKSSLNCQIGIDNLTQLTVLDLSGNKLTQLPESIGNLTQLAKLDLSGNKLTQLPESIGNLTQLTVLNLGGNKLTQLPDWIDNLTQMTVLNLGGNKLTQLPKSIGNLTQLAKLVGCAGIWVKTSSPSCQIGLTTSPNDCASGMGRDLGGNQLTQLPESIGNLTQLTVLDLGGNQLTQLPDWIDNLTKLTVLWSVWIHKSTVLSVLLTEWDGQGSKWQQAHTTARVHWQPHPTGQASGMDRNLGGNKLTQLPDWIDNLTQLTVLYLGGNKLTQLPDWIDNLTTDCASIGNLTQLTVLVFVECAADRVGCAGIWVTNKLTQLPDWIDNLTQLTVLDLGGNKLTQLPESIATSPTAKLIWVATSSHNCQSIGNLTQLTVLLVLRDNQLTQLPRLDWQPHPNDCAGSGWQQLTQLPDWIDNLTQLTVLVGWSRVLATSSHNCQMIGNLTQLTELNLGGNQLTQLPDWIDNLTQLTVLVGWAGSGGNQLTQLPDWIDNLTQLTVLDLGGNQLTQLPDWIDNLTQLTVLVGWQGSAWQQLTQLPDWIDNLTQLTELYLGGNQLTQLPDWIDNLTQLTVLVLRDNQLTQLPKSIGNLTQLTCWICVATSSHNCQIGLTTSPNWTVLCLGGNKLTQLPESIGNLTQLAKLYLGGNQLTRLPKSIGNLTQLTVLVDGRVLSKNQLTQLPKSIGNLTQLTDLTLLSVLLTEWDGQGIWVATKLTQLPDWIGNLTQLTVL